MQAQQVKQKTNQASSKGNASAAPAPHLSYLTPEKKTQICNYSPGKKAVMDPRAAAFASQVHIKPFSLFMEIES